MSDGDGNEFDKEIAMSNGNVKIESVIGLSCEYRGPDIIPEPILVNVVPMLGEHVGEYVLLRLRWNDEIVLDIRADGTVSTGPGYKGKDADLRAAQVLAMGLGDIISARNAMGSEALKTRLATHLSRYLADEYFCDGLEVAEGVIALIFGPQNESKAT